MARLRCCLSKAPLKRNFLEIYLATFPDSVISEIQNLWGSYFFRKRSKFHLRIKNAAKNWEKLFCFWDNCIWIGIVKFSLLRTGYFSSAANVLTRVPRFFMLIRGTFSNSIDLAVINELDKGDVMQIWTVLGHLYHLASRTVV